MAFLFNSLLSLLALISLGDAHTILLRAHSLECFHEQLHKDDKMTVTFQVGDREFGGSGNLEVDFWVRIIRYCITTTITLTIRLWLARAWATHKPDEDGRSRGERGVMLYVHVLIRAPPDTNTKRRIPNTRETDRLWGLLLRRERGWAICLLLQQREMVSEHKRSQL